MMAIASIPAADCHRKLSPTTEQAGRLAYRLTPATGHIATAAPTSGQVSTASRHVRIPSARLGISLRIYQGAAPHVSTGSTSVLTPCKRARWLSARVSEMTSHGPKPKLGPCNPLTMPIRPVGSLHKNAPKKTIEALTCTLCLPSVMSSPGRSLQI